MSRLKFSIYGNCQVRPLSKILQCSTEFSLIYQEVFVAPLHLISQDEVDRFAKTIGNLDLFIHQPVSARLFQGTRLLGTERLLTCVRDSARVISFPVAYFTGYNPEAVYLRDKNGNAVVDGFCAYHDLNILKAYHHGMTWRECVSHIQKSAIYTSELLETNLADSLGRLRERERVTDVTISAFIEKNWREQRLFFNFNHCSNSLLLHEANQILHLLGLPTLDPAILTGRPEHLGDTRLFVYPHVRKYFALSFAEEPMQVSGRAFTLDDTIMAYFEYYSTRHELVRDNIDSYSRSSDATLSRIASYWTVPCCIRRWSGETSNPVQETLNNHSYGPEDKKWTLEAELQRKDAQIRDLMLRFNNLQFELDMIKSSTTWRVASRLRPIINRVLSTSYYCKLGLIGMRIILNEGWRSFFRRARFWLRNRGQPPYFK
jgi:hypothetical protein